MSKTIPNFIYENSKKNPDKPVFVYKKDGNWTPILWKDFVSIVEYIAIGLVKLGFKEGEIGSIFSYNSPQWFYFDVAFQWVHGLSTPIYFNSTGEQAKYIIGHTESRFIFVDKIDRWEKIKPFIDELGIEKVFVPERWDKNSKLMTIDELIQLGKDNEDLKKDVRKRFESIKQDDLYTIVFTSGTTGVPKGVMLTHFNTYYVLEVSSKLAPLYDSDTGMSYLPLAHVAQRIADYAALYNSVPGYFAETLEQFPETLVETKPSIIVAVPRILEKIYTRIQSRVESAPDFAKKIFRWGEKIANDYYEADMINKKVPYTLKIKWKLANKLIYSKIRKNLDENLRIILCGGAPLPKYIGSFFYGIGIPIIEIYGLTEVSAPISHGLEEDLRFGTVNKVFPGGEIKFTDDKELLYRGPNLFKGYYKNQEATESSIDKEGWFHTGDIGMVDNEGYLLITGRKKELIVTSGGKNIAPTPIEEEIKELTMISQVIIVGDDKKYLTALITIDELELEEWAKENSIDYTDLSELTQDKRIYNMVKKQVDYVNSKLPSYETVKDFRILERDFSIEEGEVTPSLKVKRNVVQKKFKELIDDMYF